MGVVRRSCETPLQTPRSVAERRRRGARHTGAETPLHPMGRGQAVPCARRGHRGSTCHLQPREDPRPEQGLCPKNTVTLRAAHPGGL